MIFPDGPVAAIMRAMRSPLASAPRWIRLTVGGLLSVLLWALVDTGLNGNTWPRALLGGVVFSLILTTALWYGEWRRCARFAPVTGSLTADQRHMAYQTARRGGVPAAPAILHAAIGITDLWIEEAQRKRGTTAVLLAVAALFCLVGAAASSPWWALGAAGFATLVVPAWREPRRIERRLDELLAAERANADSQAAAQWGRRGPAPN